VRAASCNPPRGLQCAPCPAFAAFSGDVCMCLPYPDGRIEFDEFVSYWRSIKPKDTQFDEACTMFHFFDADGSGELSKEEFSALLNQIFPEHCEENEQHVAKEFEIADVNSSDGVCFEEFLMYYARLKTLYAIVDSKDPTDAAERTDEVVSAQRESLAASMVACRGCGCDFLPDRIAAHERACEKCNPSKAGPAAALSCPETSIQFAADNGPNNFVPCELCGRRFFPDRLPVHIRVCKKKHGHGCGVRETMADGQSITVGHYDAAA